jgi:nucleoside-diphosphate-sugar epimerase
MNVLVTGATGFVGSHLIPKLLDDTRYTIKILARSYTNLFDKGMQILIDENMHGLKKAFESFVPEIIVHLATYASSGDDVSLVRKTVESNVLFVSMVLEALKNKPVKLFVNTGTFAEFRFNDGRLNPAYFYSASKSAARHIIKYFQNIIGFKMIHVIPYTIYGGTSQNKKVIDYIIDSLDSTVPVEMTSGEQVLDFIHIDDVVNFYVYCIRNNELLEDGMDYHLGTGKGISIRQLAELIEMKSGRMANIKWGARQYRQTDVMKAVAPLESIKKISWMPQIDINIGLALNSIISPPPPPNLSKYFSFSANIKLKVA